MASISEIKQRIKVVNETEQIARAMHLISISKMKRALKQSAANHDYMQKVRYAIKEILMSSQQVQHSFLQHHKGGHKRAAYVVIASDKTMCGAYNHNVLNTAWEHMQDKEEVNILSVGFMTTEFFESKGQSVDIDFLHTAQNPSLYNARNIADDIISLYNNDIMDELYVVFTEFLSTARQRPRVLPLLPMELKDFDDIPEMPERTFDLLYHPSVEEAFDTLAPQYVIGMVYSALIQASASEHCARMMAMETAMRNAQEMIHDLEIEYNRARQDSITEEIIEISSAASAMLEQDWR